VSEVPAERRYEVVVVGAGVIGLACAWRIAQTGRSVLVVDRAEPGAGASGVAAGMLAPVMEADFGEEALLRLNLEGAAAWPGFAAELAERTGIDLGYVQSGALVVALDRDDAEELRRLHELQRSLGLDAEWLTARECRRLEPGLSPRVRGGVHAPHDHQVDPRAVLQALRTALEQAGGEILARAEVEAFQESDGAVSGVDTSAGFVAADHVVLAAGAWSQGLPTPARAHSPPVRPVKGQVLRLGGPASPLLAERVVRTPRCYVVCRRTGEVVVGATMEERGFDTAVRAGAVHQLLEDARDALPDIDERELVEASAGLRPATPDNRPIIGAAKPDGLVWATGHYRHGVLLAPLTGAAVADIVAGRGVLALKEDFSPDRFADRSGLVGSAP
jgi:glycine oxidase